MKISDARLEVVDAALQSANTWTYTKQDRAIQVVGNDFVNYTGILTQSTDRTIAADAVAVDLTTSDLTAFRPANVDRFRIGSNKVRRVDYDFIQRKMRAYPDKREKPKYIGFSDMSASGAHIWPSPDQSYTLTMVWKNPFSTWTPGTTTSDVNDTELNIPDRYIRRELWEGGAAMLVYGEATRNPWPVTGWERYLSYREEVRKIASMEAGITRPNVYTEPDRPTPMVPTGPPPQATPPVNNAG